MADAILALHELALIAELPPEDQEVAVEDQIRAYKGDVTERTLEKLQMKSGNTVDYHNIRSAINQAVDLVLADIAAFEPHETNDQFTGQDEGA